MGYKENPWDKLRPNLGKCSACGDYFRLLCINGLCSDCCGSAHFVYLPTYRIQEKSYDGIDDEARQELVIVHNPRINIFPGID